MPDLNEVDCCDVDHTPEERQHSKVKALENQSRKQESPADGTNDMPDRGDEMHLLRQGIEHNEHVYDEKLEELTIGID